MQQIVNRANAQLRQRFGAPGPDALEIQHAFVNRNRFGFGLFGFGRFFGFRNRRRNLEFGCEIGNLHPPMQPRRARPLAAARFQFLRSRCVFALARDETVIATREGAGCVHLGDGRAIQSIFQFIQQFAGHAHDMAARLLIFVRDNASRYRANAGA